MTGEASEGTDRREGRESEEDDNVDERVDRALDELEERAGKEGQSVDDKVDEFLDELEENERDAQEADDKVNEALDEIEENENQEREVGDVLDSLKNARDDLHREFVHDMHENCPAKEAFSEEAKLYYENEAVSEDVESSEGKESYSETGDGSTQVLKGESESTTSSEEETETESSGASEEMTNESEASEEANASSPSEQQQQEDHETSQQSEESVAQRMPEIQQGYSAETEPDRGTHTEGSEVTESRRRSVEQSTLDEFEDAEASGDASEDLRTESTDSSEESEERRVERVEEIERNIEDTENPDAQEATEPTADTDKAEGYADTNSEVSHDSHDEAGELADCEGSEDTMHSAEGGESYETGEEQQESVSEIEATQEPEHESHSREEGATEAQEAEEVVVDSEEDQTESLEDESETEEWRMPSMLPENYSFDIFPETEEENFRPALLSETIQGIWESLSDEEREEIRPFLRKGIESEEDLEEELERSPSVKYSSDFEEDLEDARAYLLLSAEDRALTETPRLLERLMNLEAERRWAELLLTQSVESIIDDSASIESEAEPVPGSRGKPREIRLHEPSIAGHAVRDIRTVRRLLKKHYPGMLERSDIDSLLKQVEDHLRLIARLSGRTTVSHRELAIISKELGIKKGNSYDWVLRGQVPNFYKILEQALSKEAAAAVLDKIRELLGSITSWTDVEARLEEMYPCGEYKQGFRYDVRKQRVKDFFKYIAELAKSGTTKGIARRAGIKIRVARAFSDGEIPWLIRYVLPVGSMSELMTKVQFKIPQIRRIDLRSLQEFHDIVDQHFPWLLERKDYKRLIRQLEAFFRLVRRYRGVEFYAPSDIYKLEKELGVSRETIRAWLIGEALPMVFDMLDKGLSIEEAEEKFREITSRLNGVESWSELRRRTKTFYPQEDTEQLPTYQKDVLHAKAFFKLLTALRKGGLHTDIAARAGLSVAKVKGLLHGEGFPWLVRTATMIPAEKPRRGYRWLPLIMDTQKRMRAWIQVPKMIRGLNEVVSLQKQLMPLKGKSMKNWKKRFGDLEFVEAFMYLLGAFTSDGTVGRKEGVSTRLGISLSKKYPWSEAFGELFCYCLGILGIRAKREKDTVDENGNEKANWSSNHSSLPIWIIRSALGLRRGQAKGKQSISADWILKMSKGNRISFVQGLADGDGHASVRGLSAGIATKTNKEFILKLLASLGIESTSYSNGIVFNKKDSLRNASQLPFFRAADGRQFRLEEIIRMIDSMDWASVSADERVLIMNLHSEGCTAGEISSILWEKLGRARRTPTIKKAIRDHIGDSA